MVISFVSLLRVGAVRTELGLNNGHERERYLDFPSLVRHLD